MDKNIWTGQLASSWNIGDNPNGGYMVACAMRVIADSIDHPDPLSVTTHFLRPGLSDHPYQIEIEVLRTGRTMTTARATLSQDKKPRLELLTVYGDLTKSAGVDTVLAVAPPDLPPPTQCPQRSSEAQGIHLPILDRLEVHLHPSQAEPGGHAMAAISGWVRFADETAPNSHALPLFADAFPPSCLALLGTIGWVPTLELTVQVRRRPVSGWIRAKFITEDLYNGRMIESGMLWDAQGDLVAQSRQLGLVTD